MEYYIMKMYEKNLKENGKFWNSFERFSKLEKAFIYGCFGIMVSSILIMCFAGVVRAEKYNRITFFCMIMSLLALFLLWVIDDKNERRNLERNANTYKAKLEILKDIIKETVGMFTTDKLEELIYSYQCYVDKRAKEHSDKIKMFGSFVLYMGGVVTFLFNGMEKMGLQINDWYFLTSLIGLVLFYIFFFSYSDKFFNPLYRKYEKMIDDLTSLKLLKGEEQ